MTHLREKNVNTIIVGNKPQATTHQYQVMCFISGTFYREFIQLVT